MWKCANANLFLHEEVIIKFDLHFLFIFLPRHKNNTGRQRVVLICFSEVS